jgi:hypothetical protein
MTISFSELVPFLFIGFIVVINIALWASLRSRTTHDQMDLLHKAGQSIQKPWEKEDRAMRELSEKVKDLNPGKKDIQNNDDD